MSALTDARTAWDTAESYRRQFFQTTDLYGPNTAAISDHMRQGDVVLLAEAIASGAGWDAGTTNRPVDPAMIEAAEALAAAE